MIRSRRELCGSPVVGQFPAGVADTLWSLDDMVRMVDEWKAIDPKMPMSEKTLQKCGPGWLLIAHWTFWECVFFLITDKRLISFVLGLLFGLATFAVHRQWIMPSRTPPNGQQSN